MQLNNIPTDIQRNAPLFLAKQRRVSLVFLIVILLILIAVLVLLIVLILLVLVVLLIHLVVLIVLVILVLIVVHCFCSPFSLGLQKQYPHTGAKLFRAFQESIYLYSICSRICQEER